MRVLSFEKLHSAKPHTGSHTNHGKEMCGKKNCRSGYKLIKEEEQKIRTGEVVLTKRHLFAFATETPLHYRLSKLMPSSWEISGKIPAGRYLGSPAGDDTIGQDRETPTQAIGWQPLIECPTVPGECGGNPD